MDERFSKMEESMKKMALEMENLQHKNEIWKQRLPNLGKMLHQARPSESKQSHKVLEEWCQWRGEEEDSRVTQPHG